MELGIKGKVALVTGGVQGIGSSITENLLREGVKVIATSRSEIAIRKFEDKNKIYSNQLILIKNELSTSDDIQKLLKEIKNRNYHVDILVNNAGHTLNVTDPYCSLEDWRKVFHLNFELPLQLINYFVPLMKNNNWGRIVNITSCAGLENSGPVTFGAAKAALTAYTRSMGRVLAIENEYVVMTAVFPGVVVTEGGHWEEVLKVNPSHAEKYIKERCPVGRFGRVDEIGPVVVMYCSQLASFSHGAIIPVDAGQSKHYMSFNYMD